MIGAQLLLSLAPDEKKIRALKRSTSSERVLKMVFHGQEHLLEKIEWVTGDTTEVYAVLEAMNGTDEVYHCAARVSFLSRDRDIMMKVNAEGTANMVNMALETGVKKFCHVSSVAALGRVEENKVLNEETAWKASKYNSNYAVSKYNGEQEVWRAMEEGLNAVIVNPTIVIGAGDWKTGSSAMFGQMWNGMRYYSEGVTGFVDVTDVTRCMTALMAKNVFGQRYILNSENLTYHTVFDYIKDAFQKPHTSIRVNKFLSETGWRLEYIRSKLMGKDPFITRETARNSQMRWYYSNDKIKKELGIEFLSIRDSVNRTAGVFLRDHAAENL